MESLNNNCRRSEFAVYPKNWLTCGKSAIAEMWYIKYRFYDDNRKKSKQVVVKGFNRYKNLKDRRDSINEEIRLVKIALAKGYNPFDGKIAEPLIEIRGEISPAMPLREALLLADKKIILSDASRQSTNKFFLPRLIRISAELQLADLPICNIGRKNIKQILERCGIKNNGDFSGDQFNRYRAMLSRLYQELIEDEIVEADIPASIRTQKGAIKTIRATLSDDQRKEVDTYLRDNYPEFWLYLHCFYHSGARSSEMLLIKTHDVDLPNQQIKFLIKKGKGYREEFRPIPDVGLKYWQAAIWQAKEADYIFSKRLKPGAAAIKPYQITKRWRRLVKEKLGIDVDFYPLKHLKATELIDSIGIDQAARQMAENAATIDKHYDVKSKIRKDDLIKKTGKEFS